MFNSPKENDRVPSFILRVYKHYRVFKRQYYPLLSFRLHELPLTLCTGHYWHPPTVGSCRSLPSLALPKCIHHIFKIFPFLKFQKLKEYNSCLRNFISSHLHWPFKIHSIKITWISIYKKTKRYLAICYDPSLTNWQETNNLNTIGSGLL